MRRRCRGRPRFFSSPRVLVPVALGIVLAVERAPLAIDLSPAFAGDASPRGERFVRPGLFFAEDVAGATEGQWRALCPRPEGLALVTTEVTIRAIPHPLSDDDSNDDDGRSIEAEGCRGALALLRVDGLTDGPVATAAAGRLPIPEETVASLIVADAANRSYLSAVRAPDGGPVEILLSRGERRQKVASIANCCNDTWPAIIWAGDLDRDGELDLLLEVSAHYAGSEQVLFLSSAAGKSGLVGKVARFTASSC
jgi:hypothetical protein